MKKALFFTFFCLLLSSCAVTNSSTGPALVVITTEGQSANNNVTVSKTGTACQYNVLGIANFGDSTIESAKGNAGIKNVATVDRDYLGILGLFGKSCVIIRGN